MNAPLPNHEPVRLLAADSAVSPTVRNLLLTPPPVKPLDAHVAMRVRGAVLQTPVGATSAAKGLGSSHPVALAKLGVVAATAALFGAGVMTLVSGYAGSPASPFGSVTDRSGVVVVSARQAQQRSPHNAVHLAEASRSATLGSANPETATNPSSNPDGRGLLREPGANTDHLAAPSRGEVIDGPVGQNGESVSGATVGRDDSADVSTESLADRARYNAGNSAGSTAQLPANAVLSVDDLASADEDPFRGSVRRSNRGDGLVQVRPAFRHIASAPEAGASRTSRLRTAPRLMSSLEEETILLEDARTKLGREPEAALTLALEHQSRFRRGQLLEQRRMIHLEALLRLGRDKEALELAKSIGSSLYQARAQALLAKYGI